MGPLQGDLSQSCSFVALQCGTCIVRTFALSSLSHFRRRKAAPVAAAAAVVHVVLLTTRHARQLRFEARVRDETKTKRDNKKVRRIISLPPGKNVMPQLLAGARNSARRRRRSKIDDNFRWEQFLSSSLENPHATN